MFAIKGNIMINIRMSIRPAILSLPGDFHGYCSYGVKKENRTNSRYSRVNEHNSWKVLAIVPCLWRIFLDMFNKARN